MARSAKPRLVVVDPDAAADYYRHALDAIAGTRFETDDGIVAHVELSAGDAVFTLAQEVAEWGLLAPGTLGGSASLITLEVVDARATAQRMVAAGGEIVLEVEDRFYGQCEGRVRDPFGHLWIPTHPLSDGPPTPFVRRIVADLAGGPNPAATADFYRSVFGLETLMDLDWVQTLGAAGRPHTQLTILTHSGHSDLPTPVASIEVGDLDAIVSATATFGGTVIYGPAIEPWGVERAFIQDPAGNVVNVLQHPDTE